ncbi:cyclic beta-1,2-glucan synthetase [Sphingomonas sp. YR710]|uniref:GH36-type glycosyl hydrolase domain-containing protein n=1 Tax=Sphingomonas sp. YR710 TaxID=1882773 RepID=UPI00088B98F7|nr:glucoamylase family protein [Sphingomonas sp. YR710]SDD80620.1 cyclic beta-1,2-glucan synthetase [Sphingomonas sp. YR710]
MTSPVEFGTDSIASAAQDLATRHQNAGLIRRSVPIDAWLHIEGTKSWIDRALTAATRADPSNASAAEWLLDNDFQIQRAILQIDEDLSRGFYARLPAIAAQEDSPPRIYILAHALLETSRLQLSFRSTIRFFDAYQEQIPLRIAELWALPIMLRIACLELLVTAFGRLFPDVPVPFAAGAASTLCDATDPNECVARAIANLGLIASIQWKDFFDQTNRVEMILRHDPADVYGRMDFETRDRYRRTVEILSQRSHLTEWDVADRAVAYARKAAGTSWNHVGYWLIGEGRIAFEDSIQSRPFAMEVLGRKLVRQPEMLYVAALSLAGLAGLVIPALYLAAAGASFGVWILGMALSALPASILSVTIVNWLVTRLVPPKVLPKLDFENGIAAGSETAVVMPVIVAHPADATRILLRLESHFLSNPDPSLHFVLLSDFVDSNRKTTDGDPAVVRALVEGVKVLNAKYGGATREPFCLLHRPRLHNPVQGCWMGWERKRGKLEQFNMLVLAGDYSPFSIIEGTTSELRNVRFVVTADADTRLPPGVVNRLVGTLAHPLNRARFDSTGHRVTSGYTILQPRVEIAPDIETRSLFTRFFGGDTAIDIYSRAVSDVYQDLLGTGIFVGKGIYDVAAFTRSLEGRIPENRLLSHDLFEGLHGRAGLASDIIIFEGFPSGYLDYARRWHRWVRGDWQILPWLLPFVPGGADKWITNRLGWFDRLKIFDNLRRSVIPTSIILLLVGGWFFLPGNAVVWTLLAIAAPGAYLFTDLVTGLAVGRRRGVLQNLGHRLVDHLGRWLLAISFLVHEATIATHAIATTLWRLGTRSRLLEWTSAAHVSDQYAGHAPRRTAWREMWTSPAFSFVATPALALFRPAALPIAAPLLLLWFLAPEIAAHITRPLRSSSEEVAEADRLFLRRIARRTWLYFETFVRPEDNWLPPDNYQEPPNEEVAHRTSPTNVGVMLLAAATAWRLGHISLREFATRLRNALDALDRLELYRGHMLNWYDTRTLQPLEPRYVSSVDSGNLAVSLVVMSQACREAQCGPIGDRQSFAGLVDELMLLGESLCAEGLDPEGRCRASVERMRSAVLAIPADELARRHVLDQLRDQDLPTLQAMIPELIGTSRLAPGAWGEVQLWIERLDHHLRSLKREDEIARPWLAMIDAAPVNRASWAAALARQLAAAPLADLAACCRSAGGAAGRNTAPQFQRSSWDDDLVAVLEAGAAAAGELHALLQTLADRAASMAHAMEFGFLFDEHSRLFHIGYNVSSDRIDQHHYDLLASEARLASFFAIAKGDIPFEHWFFLGRPITKKDAGLALVSWNGSMFEYLMPDIFLRSDPGTLLGQSDRTAVDLQRAYARAHGIPWGISESAYASLGPDRAYRYHAFGVPGLGLRRGLEKDLVIAPYASALALPVRTRAAIRNLRTLAELGMIGRYGFYEAIDFTPGRMVEKGKPAIVRSYMVHHHGMSLAAIGNVLCDDMHVRLFHADPHVRTVDLLLNERIPWELPPELARRAVWEAAPSDVVAIPTLHPWEPRSGDASVLHVIGNGRMTSRFGPGGCSLHWQDCALTAAVPGPWLMMRDTVTGDVWDGAPMRSPHDKSRITLHADRIECHLHQHDIAVATEFGVIHGDDVEIRRVALVNEGNRPRTIDLTSYAEIVLAAPRDAARHPAFSKLFVHSEPLVTGDGLLFTRRPRSPDQHLPVLIHRVIGDDLGLGLVSLEADRAVFLGRHGRAAAPAAMRVEALGGSTGWTLDPVMALRFAIDLAPGERREIAFITVAAASRATALEIAERYTTLAALQWAMNDAVGHVARAMYELGLTPETVPDAHMLLAHMAGQDMHRAPDPLHGPLGSGRRELWSLGISGDEPILLLREEDGQGATILRLALAAQKLCRLRGVPIDLVVIHGGAAGYIEPVRDQLMTVLRDAGVQELLGQRGGVHLVATGHAESHALHAVEHAARLTLDEAAGSIHEVIEQSRVIPHVSPQFAPIGSPPQEDPQTVDLARPKDRLHDNGIGGFTADGAAYVIHLEPGETTPAPWSNILANDSFGTIVTEAGLGFSWALNSGENRLTPWSNDPVRDPQGEAVFLRDEENAHLWTVSPQPAGDDTACRITHGTGYSRWERSSEGLAQDMLVFVAPDDPVKLVRLRLRNLRPRSRRITATYYAEWLLGTARNEAAPLRVADFDTAIRTLIAVNPWSEPFRDRVAFLTATLPPHSLSSSRSDFLGANWQGELPAALRNWDLGGRLRAAADDCCAAYQVHLEIAPDAEIEVVFILGQGDDHARTAQLATHWQDPAVVEHAYQQCLAAWEQRLGAVSISTPDSAFDILVNRWLPYQAISGRLWARAGFYQAGGAFGFRDQLQDVMALLHADPALVRAHILEAARHQFEEGDVLHWWHPPGDAGVRTRCSDDLLWLPFAVGTYVAASGDEAILDEQVSYLRAPPLADDEDDRYATFAVGETRSLFHHCERALERAHALGRHGLPLIGAGDWNDGMNRIGAEGRGESVWLGWFLIATANIFLPLCKGPERAQLTERWRRRTAVLAEALEANAWDGDWYVRAFDDDGRPWGSSADGECRIDSIAQSWAQLSGAGNSDRVRRALASARQYLVKADDRIVRLLDPPFDATPRDPGYIKAYPPGIRENGGQYTHAAAWLGIALAQAGDGDGAMEVFRRINPICQTMTANDVRRYRTEPYVLSADVAGIAPHLGRGGWSWYTGAAAWTWRLAVEHVLGIGLTGGQVRIGPSCWPSGWDRVEITLRRPGGSLRIMIDKSAHLAGKAMALSVDGSVWPGDSVPFPTDGSTRVIEATVVDADPEPLSIAGQA